jgi:hypothetical protein
MALLQGVLFILLTLTSATLIGRCCGAVAGSPGMGARVGLGVGCFFAVAGFSASVDEVAVSPAQFIEWWFHCHLLLQLAMGLAFLSYYAFRVTHLHPVYCGLLAAFIGYPLSAALLSHLFPTPDMYPTVVAKPLSSYQDAVRRANLVGRVQHGPGAMRRAREGPDNWERFYDKIDRLLRRFYGEE